MRRLVTLAVVCAASLLDFPAHAAPSKAECLDANSTAQDLRRAGKLRAAREKLALCVDAACPGPVREDCAERLHEIEKIAPTLVFGAKDSAGNDLSAVVVTMDGPVIAEKLDGSPLAVDPGEHAFSFEAKGLPKVEKTLVIHEGEKDRHERIAFAGAKPEGGESSPSRVPAIIAFGAGGVGLIVGFAFTGLWVSDKNAGDTACGSRGELVGKTGNCPNQQAADGFSGRQSGDTAGLVIAYLLAAAGIATGTILLLTSGASKGTARIGPRVDLGWAGVEGSFW